MKKQGLLKYFILIFFLLSLHSAIGQNSEQQEMFINTQVRNAKILFNKNNGQAAIRILESLHRQVPKNGEINYLLSILYLKVRKDLGGMKKWYLLAQKANPRYKSPIKLTDSEIKAFFEPQRISAVDINLKTIFKEVEKNLQRGKWQEAKNIFKSGGIYYPDAGSDAKNTYNLLGAYIFDHYDSLYYGLKYFSSINSALLMKKKYKEMYGQIESKWSRKYEYFKKEFSNRHTTLAKLTTLIEQKKYKRALVFIDLVAPLFANDIQYIALFNLYKLEATIALDRLEKARKLSDALRNFITSRQLPPSYVDKLNALDTDLIFKESRIRIGRKLAEIDSMMLKGYVDDGLKRYENLLERQQTEKLDPDFIYFSLATIMKDVGRYDEARKYLKKVSPSPGNRHLVDAKADTITKAEKFELLWHTDFEKVSRLYQLGKLEQAHKQLLPLLTSPYLRYGLKYDTYSLMAKIYFAQRKLSWAKRMAVYASKYSDTKYDLFLQKLEEKQVENPLTPQLPHRKLPFSVLFKHPQSVQLILQPLKAGDVYAQHPPTDTLALRMVPGQPNQLVSATPYLVDSGERTSFQNYIIGLGAMFVSILFINAR